MKKKIFILFILMCLFQVMFILYWGNEKDSFYIDEFYTYEGAAGAVTKSGQGIEALRWNEQPGFLENYHSREEFLDHMSLSEEKSLLNQPVSFILKNIVNGFNMHYSLVNIACSFFPESFSKWYGIGLNILLFFCVQVLLYAVGKKVTGNQWLAFALVCIYGFSGGAVQTVIYIRFYILYLFFTLLYLFLHLKIAKKEGNQLLLHLGLLPCLWFGFKNAEYMLVFAFFYGAFYVRICFLFREWKRAFQYCATFIAAGGLFALCSMEKIAGYMQNNSQVNSAIQILEGRSLKEFFCFVNMYGREIAYNAFGKIPLMLFMVLIACKLINAVCSRYKLPHNQRPVLFSLMRIKSFVSSNRDVIIIFLTCICYTFTVARLCPYTSWRYVSNLFPCMMLVIVYVISKLVKTKRSQMIAYGIYGLGMLQILIFKGHYLAPVHGGVSVLQQSQIEASVGGTDGVYLYDNDEIYLYYNAFLWPSNTSVYVTRPEHFFGDQTVIDKVTDSDSMLLWVSQKEGVEKMVNEFTHRGGFKDAQLVFEVNEAGYGKFGVYLCTK